MKLFFSLLLLAAPVAAEPPPLQFGLRGTYSKLLPLQTPNIVGNFDALVPVGLEVGYWLGDVVYAGLYLEYSFGVSSCSTTYPLDCSVYSAGGGFDLRYALRPHTRVRPWFGVSLGIDRLREFGDSLAPGPPSGRFVFDKTEIRGGVTAGTDFYATSRFAVGPYLAARLANASGTQNSANQSWVMLDLGLRLSFRLDSCGSTLPCPEATNRPARTIESAPPSPAPGEAEKTVPEARPPPDRGWALDVDVGLGYAAYSAPGDSTSSVGPAFGFHLNYRFIPQFGLGLAVLDSTAIGGSDGSVNLLGLGLDARILIGAWTLTATPLFTHLTKFDISSRYGLSTNDSSGFGFAIGVGRQWPWGKAGRTVGFLVQYTYTSLGDSSDQPFSHAYQRSARAFSIGSDMRF
jgi:hypothetical protein